MQLTLCDVNNELVDCWKKAFQLYPEVKIVHGSILDLEVNAIVSATGGLDFLYARRFGSEFAERVESYIEKSFCGLLPVGQAMSVWTADSKIPEVIIAPTMTVPLNIQGTINVFLAFRAALIEAADKFYNTLACPGLGTGCGKVEPEIAALQMLCAYQQIEKNYYRSFASLRDASEFYQYMANGTAE